MKIPTISMELYEVNLSEKWIEYVSNENAS